MLASAAVYAPAWRGGLLWDDNFHLTVPALRSVSGLRRIWFEIGATPQYYPVTHSLFWVLQRLWGEATLGYHLTNIVLHAGSACLFAVLLRRLSVPGALFAAFIFALHPVHVESVAWMTELKNTLSGILYLGSALAYLEFDGTRRRGVYAAAIALFVAAVLSKSVTATLPAVLLIVLWWQRGRLTTADFVPLIPFFAVGGIGGLSTAWIEQHVIGAAGAPFQYGFVARTLIAGRAIWFYMAALVWPAHLTFIYPHWAIDPRIWWQYLYPLAAVLAGVILWIARRRSRGPFAAFAIFVVTLFPALGFFNVYPFQYSFVADHFQYLASLSLIALASAGAARLWTRWTNAPVSAAVASLAVLVPLGFLTWRQSHDYADLATLYRRTLERNPTAWMAHNNLGEMELYGGDAELDDAIVHFQQAIALHPGYAEAHNNLGCAWQRRGRFDAAIEEHQEAARLKPDYPEAYYNLGLDLQNLGRPEDAAAEYRRAIALKPGFVAARQNLGVVLQDSGRTDEAIAEIGEAVRLDPGAAAIRYNLALALQRKGRLDDAVVQLMAAVQVQPDHVAARFLLANILKATGHLEDAVAQYQQALRYAPEPASAEVHNELGVALARLGDGADALAEFQEAVRINPSLSGAQENLAKARRLASGKH